MKALSNLKTINIDGYLMALYDNDPSDPVLIVIEGQRFLPVYSTAEKLRESMNKINVTDYTIKQITDGRDFLDSVSNMNVCADPYEHNGNTRFTNILGSL